MTLSTKVAALVVVATLGVILTLVLINRSSTETAATGGGSALVRPDSHRLSIAPDGKVTVVEFLDFECEVCGAAFAGVEQLRAEYSDRVTFVVRYFPIPSHRNAETAARVVEAAGQQGQWEPMYRKMFQTQAQWGDQQVSHADTFRGFARELGLDMAQFEAAWTAPDTGTRVLADRADGMSLGVQGTPTFFINDTRFTGRPTYAALKAAIDTALAA
ncbi:MULTISPECIES: DsbA family protein [Nocardia]|uniref:DsbA family protein n=1 Tax=Nocardia TaxID=1817 RepID=UPI00059284B4|nr:MULTISPECIES: thioredoxin domain-containing protein [Nocardia]